MTATQMATPSDQALSSLCSLTADPNTVEICSEEDKQQLQTVGAMMLSLDRLMTVP